MNNLSSYCGLTDSRMSAFEKDLPVPWCTSLFVCLYVSVLQNFRPEVCRLSRILIGKVADFA